MRSHHKSIWDTALRHTPFEDWKTKTLGLHNMDVQVQEQDDIQFSCKEKTYMIVAKPKDQEGAQLTHIVALSPNTNIRDR